MDACIQVFRDTLDLLRRTPEFAGRDSWRPWERECVTSSGFHDQPFEESTLTKLRIFEMYAKAWVPVFVARLQPSVSSLHVYDFMAGPGKDAAGNAGTPLRLLKPRWTPKSGH